MRRFPRLVAGAALLLTLGVAVAQTPPAAAPAGTDLFPVKFGSKWTYKVGEAQTIEVKVDKVDADGATFTTSVNGKTVAKETYKVSADGVVRTKINDAAITPPVQILKLPAKKDASWPVEAKVQEQPIKGKFPIKDEKEKVKVKEKDYEAVVVDGPDFEIAGTKTSVKYWFAPGKGIVKLSYSIAGNEAVLELTEYAEGK